MSLVWYSWLWYIAVASIGFFAVVHIIAWQKAEKAKKAGKLKKEQCHDDDK